MRLLPLLAGLAWSAPTVGATSNIEQRPQPSIAVAMNPGEGELAPGPYEPQLFDGLPWAGIFYVCADAHSARAVFEDVRRAAPASSLAAWPLLKAGAARRGCIAASEPPDWSDMPAEYEFAEDGEGLQLMTGSDPRGRPVGIVYRRGAC